jgi:ribonuclease HI
VRYLFTDGSQKSEPQLRTGAGWAVFDHTGLCKSGQFGYGQATPYDAEMAALARRCKELISSLPGHVNELHIFVDNRAAALSIFGAGQGPAQLLSVLACRTVRPFLHASPAHTIHVHWCPAYIGVAQNELVDQLAKEGLDALQPEFSSQSIALQRVTAHMYTAWTAEMQNVHYRGRHNLIPSEEFRLCKHTYRDNVFLKLLGQDTQLFARTVCFISGHMPCGAFRERFNLEGHRQCWCGAAVESREHILDECPLWIREHPPPGSDGSRHLSVRDIIAFLRLNPMVGTFEWLDLVREGLASVDVGQPCALAPHRANAHSRWRRAIYKRWKPRVAKGDRFEKVYDPEQVAARAFQHFAAPVGVS